MQFSVFVYGTLKTGEPNHRLMKGDNVGSCILKGNGVSVNKYPLVIASRYNNPYMLGEEGKGHNIHGEVYEVDADQLARLDKLENHPNLYVRQEIEVEMLDGDSKGSRLTTMAYLLDKFQPYLLDLPMFDNYTDHIDGQKFVPVADRDIKPLLWWYEVHEGYTDPNADENVGTCILKGNGKSVNKYPLVIASRYNIPFMLGQEGKGHNIHGEIYEVGADQLARLDVLENHPKLYERQEIEVEMVDGDSKGSRITAMAYLLVKFQPHLLNLPMIDNYADLIDGKKYVGPKDRDASSMPSPLWWYEVHRDYTEPKL